MFCVVKFSGLITSVGEERPDLLAILWFLYRGISLRYVLLLHTVGLPYNHFILVNKHLPEVSFTSVSILLAI